MAAHIERFRGIVFNLLFAVYILFLAPRVLASVSGIVYGDENAPLWGIIILAVIVLETIGLIIKLPTLADGSSAGFGIFLWMFHAVIEVILVFIALTAFGIKIKEQPLCSIALVIVVIKELIILMVMLNDSPKQRRPGSIFAADLFLLAFACIAYTAIWEVIFSKTRSQALEWNTAEAVIQTIAAAFCFLLLFLPMRMAFLLEEAREGPTPGLVLSYGLVLATVLASLHGWVPF